MKNIIKKEETMTQHHSKERRETILPTMGVVITSAPSLFFKFGGVFLRFKRSARKGGKIFYKELRRQGLDAETAESLTETYLESSKISALFPFS